MALGRLLSVSKLHSGHLLTFLGWVGSQVRKAGPQGKGQVVKKGVHTPLFLSQPEVWAEIL